MKFNGYRNWETYTVNLHLDDDISAMMEDWTEGLDLDDEDTTQKIRTDIKEFVWEHYHDQCNERFQMTLMGDFISGCLSEVNWYELADHHLTQHKETITTP